MSTQAEQAASDLRSALNNLRSLGMQCGIPAVVARKLGVNLNSAGDTAIPFEMPRPLILTSVLIANASGAMTTFAAQIWTAAGGTGISLSTINRPTAAGQSRAQNASNYANITDSQVYCNVATPEGSAATVDIYLFGYYAPASL